MRSGTYRYKIFYEGDLVKEKGIMVLSKSDGTFSGLAVGPLPFRSGGGNSLLVRFNLLERSVITVKLYNLAGQLAGTLADSEPFDAGAGLTLSGWDGGCNGQAAASGTYTLVFRVRTGDGKDLTYTRNIMVLGR